MNKYCRPNYGKAHVEPLTEIFILVVHSKCQQDTINRFKIVGEIYCECR